MIKIITDYGGMLFSALGQTLIMALCSLLFACMIGLIFGILSVLKNKACNAVYRVFVDVVRGVPMIVLAFFVYFGVPMAVNNMFPNAHFTLTALQAGIVCLSLNCGAYMAEIIRAGIQSVDIGQMEACRSLGMTYGQAMRKVVLPQAIKTMIPSIINQFIITLKDTSILSVIGFPELVNTTKNVISVSMDSFGGWACAGIMYLVVITILSYIAKFIERRMNRGR